MPDKILFKIGYYTVIERITQKGTKYVADSGKTIYIDSLKKYIINKNRDVKEFSNMDKLRDYVQKKLDRKLKEKIIKYSKIPKSLYLVLIKEIETDKTFIKVGITSKKFLMRRFSKKHGYKGYLVETILRRIDTPEAEKLEEEIKQKLNKKKSVKKYRPILESFSGYSECYDILSKDVIITIFDNCVNKS